MSGVEFIAVVGAIASVVTIVDACKRISTRLKDSKHIPPLSSLALRIDLVADALSLLQTDVVEDPKNEKLRLCLLEVGSLLIRLEQCISVLDASARDNVLKAFSSRRKTSVAIQQLRELEADLDRWQLTLSINILARMSNLAANPSSKLIASSPSVLGIPYKENSDGNKKKKQQKSTCQKGTCFCPCHLSKRQQRALVIYAPTHLLFRCSCYVKEICLNISALQRILSIQVNMDWSQGLRLNCLLRLRNTVKRTSPGFLIIEKCYYGRLSFEQARHMLCRLRDANVIDFTDITPDGDGMLEVRFRWQSLAQYCEN